MPRARGSPRPRAAGSAIRGAAGSASTRPRARRPAARPPRRRHARASAAATPSWNAAAISGPGRPAARSSATAATRSAPRITPPSTPAGVGLGDDVAGELLELDRGLALVADRVAHAEQRRDRVEQAARARRKRRVDREALAHQRPALPRHRPAGALQVRGRDPPRLAHRRLAAGERHGSRWAAARTTAGRSAAPRRPRSSRRARNPVPSSTTARAGRSHRARPGTRRRARGGAAPRAARGPGRPPPGARSSRNTSVRPRSSQAAIF